MQRVESLDAMPQLWSIDDKLLALDRLPRMFRNAGLQGRQDRRQERRPEIEHDDRGGSRPRGRRRSGRWSRLKDRLTRHPLFLGTVIDATGTTTSVVVRLKKTHQHNVIETVAAMRRIADEFAARHHLGRPAVVGPPVLLSDGFAAIEVDGRRLAVVGMILIGVVTLSAVQSLWWAIVPMLAGWVVWLATEAILATFNIKLSLSGGPLVAQIIVLTMPAASHLAIHFRDDRRREADPRQAARIDPGRGRRADPLDGDHRRDRLRRTRHQRRGADSAIWRDPATCTFAAAILVMLISPIAMLPPFRLEVPVRHGSHSPVAGLMNRLILQVYRHPGAIVLAVFAVVLPVAGGCFVSVMKPIISICFGPRRASSRIITPSKSGSAALDWSSWWCRWAHRWARVRCTTSRRSRIESGRSRSAIPTRSPRCSRWPPFLTPTDKLAALPAPNQDASACRQARADQGLAAGRAFAQLLERRSG